jgi:PAS domain S-box-containing protein
MTISYESLVETVFERMPMGVAIFDGDGRIVRLNAKWIEFAEALAQRPIEGDWIGRTAFELFPETADWAQGMGQKVFAGETVLMESIQVYDHGRTRYWDAAFSPIYENDQVAGIIEIVSDVTERELAHRELEERVRERTEEIARRQEVADGLHFILDTLNSCCPEEEVLDFVIAEAKRLLGSEAIAVYTLHVTDGLLTMETQRGLDDEFIAALQIPVLGQGHVARTIMEGKPMVMPEVAPLLETSREQMPPEMYDQLAHALERYKSVLAVPMLVGGELYGGLTMYYPERRDFTPEDIALAEDLADHLSLALENARLRESAEESAASAERSRLARDLHDAVTQTLFSASLIAEVLPQLWERNPEEGRKRLGQLRDLTRGALAEMRTLLLELRPAALAEAPLCDLLLQLAEATRGRSGIDIGVGIEGECEVPADAKIALYRIAQEALNNVAKHAGAEHAWLTLKHTEDGVDLVIEDDGAGFDIAHKKPESLGLDIMKERADSVGAELRISSTPGEGTRIDVMWRTEGEGPS